MYELTKLILMKSLLQNGEVDYNDFERLVLIELPIKKGIIMFSTPLEVRYEVLQTVRQLNYFFDKTGVNCRLEYTDKIRMNGSECTDKLMEVYREVEDRISGLSSYSRSPLLAVAEMIILD